MTVHSLKTRLLAAGAIILVLALGLTGFGLASLFERHVERRIGLELDTYITQIASRLTFKPSGMPRPGGKLADPRFEKIYSGLYWQINNETAGLTVRSRSLWDTQLILPVDSPGFGNVHIHTTIGPQDNSLLAHERRLKFKSPQGEQIARLIVAINVSELDKMSADFTNDVAIALLGLAAFLLLAGWMQIAIGLGPLSLIQKSIAAIRHGKASRIDPVLPKEVALLADEVNNLLELQEKTIEKASHRASDLAHGFKTPLTALRADVARLRNKGEHDLARDIEVISQVMQRQIDRELTKARFRDVRTMCAIKVRPVIESIVTTLQRTPAGERKIFLVECDPDTEVQIDRDDLTEIMGNLLENAVRHANRTVRITVRNQTHYVRFEIEDDGNGISGDLRNSVQKRGVRLDQSPSGAGLGLAIVNDILEVYDQRLELNSSPLGGLKGGFKIPRFKRTVLFGEAG